MQFWRCRHISSSLLSPLPIKMQLIQAFVPKCLLLVDVITDSFITKVLFLQQFSKRLRLSLRKHVRVAGISWDIENRLINSYSIIVVGIVFAATLHTRNDTFSLSDPLPFCTLPPRVCLYKLLPCHNKLCFEKCSQNGDSLFRLPDFGQNSGCQDALQTSKCVWHYSLTPT